MKHTCFFSVVGLCLVMTFAQAESLPQGTVTDSRVKLLVYNTNQVYKLVAYYGYQIDIQLADAEEIKTIAAGDSVGWQIVGSGQHIFIKPMANDARTNLSIITTKRTYIFDLSSRSPERRGTIAYLVRFRYPELDATSALVSSAANTYAPRFNFEYKISGSHAIEPRRVFDDGQFTYFQFDRKLEMPAIFVVGPDGKEGLVNYRIEGPYVVVERLADFYTLRAGKQTATAINQSQLGKDPS